MTQAQLKFASFEDYLVWSNAPEVEVLSPGQPNRDRDLVYKRDQYATLGIPEYWVIDPEVKTVTVLQWQDAAYAAVGVFQEAEVITSPTLPDLTLRPATLFGDQPAEG